MMNTIEEYMFYVHEAYFFPKDVTLIQFGTNKSKIDVKYFKEAWIKGGIFHNTSLKVKSSMFPPSPSPLVVSTQGQIIHVTPFLFSSCAIMVPLLARKTFLVEFTLTYVILYMLLLNIIMPWEYPHVGSWKNIVHTIFLA
jgi:hypothetical protein